MSTNTTTTGTKAKKARKAKAPATPNPYKKGSNHYLMTEALKRGGKRPTLVKALLKKIEMKPRAKDAGSDEWNEEAEMDYRLLTCAQLLRKQGWTVEREGRGYENGTIKVFPPES